MFKGIALAQSQGWYYPLKVDCVKKAHLVKWTYRQPEGIFYDT
jgi:hypothetical protein